MSNKVKKAANKLYKQLKGNITFEALEVFLKNIGYKIIFFNTPQGDVELARYCLTEKAQQTNAFTYCGNAKIVFINGLMSVEDKFYLLLHEVAHIILKHLEPRTISMHNKLLLDIDADAFAYLLLNPQQSPRKALVIGCIVLVTILGAFFYNPTTNTTTVPKGNFVSQSESIVYITSTGQHFHFANCGTITGRATAQIKRDEALKIHTPCKMCNP